MYAKIGEDGSVWAPLVEKAMAYIHGTYEALDCGWTSAALNTLAGSPGKDYQHKRFASDMWDRLIKLPDSVMLTASVTEGENGILDSHAYTVLRPI